MERRAARSMRVLQGALAHHLGMRWLLSTTYLPHKDIRGCAAACMVPRVPSPSLVG